MSLLNADTVVFGLHLVSVFAVFLAGFFYPRANARGCLVALVAGPLWASRHTVAEAHGSIFQLAFLTRAGLDFLFCGALIWALRTRGETLPAQALVDRSFPPEDAALMQTIPRWRRFGF